MPNIALLGSTGSIGTQAIEVIQGLPDYTIVSLAAGSNEALLREQIEKLNPQYAALQRPDAAARVRQQVAIPVSHGMEGLVQLATDPQVDLVINAVVGAAGLAPTLAALRAGKRVALANKETLVAGGHLVMAYRDQLIPIDSEHSALWQCLRGHTMDEVASLVLTASGGPFRKYQGELHSVTRAQALRHPNWEMGGKITIDSATLMNKGLEVIEAHWLFGASYDQIEVVVHPQSIVHSLVKMKDGSYLAHLGAADMRLPIQYAITYPHCRPATSIPLDLTTAGPLEFEAPDEQRFPCLPLAYAAGRAGGSVPAVLNAANEVAVEYFLNDRLGFMEIPVIVESVLEGHAPIDSPDLDTILAVDAQARQQARQEAEQRAR